MRMFIPPPGPAPCYSVIVVNWNGRHLLEECLDSVLVQQDGPIEIIVVDNGSTDGSAGFIRERYGNRVRLIELAENQGWAGGNNRGIETARGGHLLLLNNDASLEREFFRHLREGIARHPDAGMYSTRILNYQDRSRIDNTGHVIFRDGTARGRSRLEKDGPEFDREAEVLCPSGAAGVYSRKLIDRVGPVDERYFAYGEDTELGLRARKAGFSCYYIPRAVVYHKYSATGGAYTLQKVFLVERNRVWTLLKLYPWTLVAVSPFLTVARYSLGLYGLLAGKGATGKLREGHSAGEIFKVLFRAYRDALAGAPEMVRARRKLRSVCTMSDREFRKMITRFSADIREVGFNE
jgi:GT2 family glycosyltransferase